MASTPNPPAQAAPPTGDQQAPPPVPFVRGSLPRVQRARQWTQSVELGAATQAAPTLSVPPHGFARSVLLHITVDSIAGGTYSADGLAAAIRSINFADTNGSDVIVPISGHDLKMVNKWLCGGGFSDPAILSDSPTEMFLRLPLEISERDALGALPNQDASSLYTVDVTFGTEADVFAVAPTNPATVTVAAYLEAWSPPQPADFAGRPVSPQPPALNTTQYVSKHRHNLPAAGNHSITLERRGNLVRGLLLIARTEAGARSDTVLPDSFRFRWDGREMFDMDTAVQRFYMRERGGMAVDTGVLLIDFTHEFDGRLGAELRDQWLRTLKSSELSLDLNGVDAAGQLSVITVDVAPAGDVYVD